VTKEDLLQTLNAEFASLLSTLEGLSEAQLGQEYPLEVAGVRLMTGDFLMHLASHFSYHLGQMDYHRRITTGGSPLGGAVSPTRLWSAKQQPKGGS